ncbi:YraN family protein [Candidatus Dependentiae bacterium]|nr:YraN family protein [Candidatus Dependentiae bacterium]
MSFYIIKTSGEKEKFNLKKLRRSLKESGAPQKLIENIVKEIKKVKPKSTKALHAHVARMLKKERAPFAARYNLKRAIMDLGPAGYLFEQFIAQLFKRQGYRVQTNEYVQGKCVSHEVDVVAQKNKEHFIIECKFHSRLGLKSDVKIPLYVKARFDDINAQKKRELRHAQQFYEAYIVTNTKFTSQAIQYAQCVGIKLLGWDYPSEKKALPHLVDEFELHPITALTTLTKQQKRNLIHEGIILCQQAPQAKKLLAKFGMGPRRIEKVMQESRAICEIGVKKTKT